jgi:hypothetical protein
MNLSAYFTYFSTGAIVSAKRCVLPQELASARIGLYQFEGPEPGRVRLFKFDSEKSKSLFRKDLP